MIKWVREKIQILKTLSSIEILLITLILGGLFVLSYFPYLPLEGDIFGCWYRYVTHLEGFKLGAALRDADASGRYPGLPLTIAIIKNVFFLDYLNTLAVLRFLFAILFTHSIYYAFKHLFKYEASLRLTWLFLLFPTFWANAFMENQDCIKIFSFIYAITFCVRYFETGIKKFGIWCIVFSIYLGIARSVELIPFFVFVMTYLFFHQNSSWSKKLKTAGYLLYPSFLVILYLHCFGRLKTGHWGLSGNGLAPPEVWFSFALEQVQSMVSLSPIEKLVAFFRLCAIVVSNKTYFFIKDYFFSCVTLNILDVGVFVSKFHQTEAYSYSLIAGEALFLAIVGYFVFRKKNTSSLGRALFLSGLSSAAFYIFFLNHYEARYWLIVFGTLFLGLAHISYPFLKKSYVFFPLLALAVWVSYPLVEWKIQFHQETWKQSRSWIVEAKSWCQDTDINTIVVPSDFFRFSSYAFYVHEACPRMQIEGSYVDNSENPRTVLKDGKMELSAKYFKRDL